MLTLQTVPAVASADDNNSVAKAAGFSLHAGVASEAHEREKLERRRYITRPAVSTERLSLTAQGNIRYRLKTPYRDGTTDVVFEPLDFMARLAARVPTPRVNLTRYHGVFAPNHRLREQVTPARRGRRKAQTPDEPAPARHVSMTWAQRLKRVFKIDILTCADRKYNRPFRRDRALLLLNSNAVSKNGCGTCPPVSSGFQ